MLADPSRFFRYSLSLLGSPFSASASILGPAHYIGFFCGLAGLAVAIISVSFGWKTAWHGERRSLCCLALGFLVFGGASLLLIAVGRFKAFSPDQIESRYSTFAACVYVGLVLMMLVPLRAGLGRPANSRIASRFFYAVCALMIFGSVFGNAVIFNHGRNIHLALSRIRAELDLSAAFPDQMALQKGIHSLSRSQLTTLLQSLEDDHLWKPRRVRSIGKADIRDLNSAGNVDGVVVAKDGILLNGWARTPQGTPPDAVLALVPDGDRWMPIAESDRERFARPDVSSNLNVPGLVESGWRLRIPGASAPRVLQLVGYSAAKNSFYRIPVNLEQLHNQKQ